MFLHFTYCKCIQNICFSKLRIIEKCGVICLNMSYRLLIQELAFPWITFNEAQNMRQDLWLHVELLTRKTLGEGSWSWSHWFDATGCRQIVIFMTTVISNN